MRLIRIRYNAKRFPRTVNLRGHKTKVFHPDTPEIDFEEYDAYLLLKNNSRIALENWEFSVVGIKDSEYLDTGAEKEAEDEKEAQDKAETPISAPKTEEKSKDTPKRGRPKKYY